MLLRQSLWYLWYSLTSDDLSCISVAGECNSKETGFIFGILLATKMMSCWLCESDQSADWLYLLTSRVADLEAACASRTSDWQPLTRSQSVVSSPRNQAWAHVPVPLTITKLSRKLREREDEIFELWHAVSALSLEETFPESVIGP